MSYKKVIVIIMISLIGYSNLLGQIDPGMAAIIKDSNDNEKLIEDLLKAVNENPESLKGKTSEIAEILNTGLKHKQSARFYLLILRLVENDLFSINESWNKALAQIHRNLRDRIKFVQTIDYQKWIWDDYSYEEYRYKSEFLLVLLGYVNSITSINELKLSLNQLYDNRLKLQAAIALLQFEQHVPSEELLKIASDDETRLMLFSNLKRINKLELFPGKYKTQEALAKSDMVVWLVHPKEMARTPDEIELIRVVSQNHGAMGDADFYMWKFKSSAGDWAEYDWMVGISGPFLRKEAPTDKGNGFTYSDFLELEEKSIVDHFNHIIDVLEK